MKKLAKAGGGDDDDYFDRTASSTQATMNATSASKAETFESLTEQIQIAEAILHSLAQQLAQTEKQRHFFSILSFPNRLCRDADLTFIFQFNSIKTRNQRLKTTWTSLCRNSIKKERLLNSNYGMTTF